MESSRAEYELTLKLSKEHIATSFSLKKENRKTFVYLSDDIKEVCHNLPADKRDQFIEQNSPEEMELFISIPKEILVFFFNWKKSTREKFVKLSEAYKN